MFGREQDLENRAAVRRRKPREIGALLFAAENLQQPAIDISLGGLGKRIEGIGIDQVAARIAEYPRGQIEVAQRSTLCVSRATSSELLRECGLRPDMLLVRVTQGGLLHEQHIAQQLFGRALELPACR